MSMGKVNVYGIDGSKKEEIKLPKVFDSSIRPDLIRKSFNSLHANKRTPYGAYKYAGTRHATASVGKGRGMSRVPRLTQGRAAALAPCVVGGRRAHPPTSEKMWKEKINKKERIRAKNSALAATGQKDIVANRGHRFNEKLTLPIIVEDSFANIGKTKEVLKSLESLGVVDDIIRAKEGTHIRAGKGKRRGRRYKTPKSVLIISADGAIKKGSKNINGIDVVSPEHLNIEHLAPGGDQGRLTIITKSALNTIGGTN